VFLLRTWIDRLTAFRSASKTRANPRSENLEPVWFLRWFRSLSAIWPREFATEIREDIRGLSPSERGSCRGSIALAARLETRTTESALPSSRANTGTRESHWATTPSGTAIPSADRYVTRAALPGSAEETAGPSDTWAPLLARMPSSSALRFALPNSETNAVGLAQTVSLPANDT
jgi:hypothetical protein